MLQILYLLTVFKLVKIVFELGGCPMDSFEILLDPFITCYIFKNYSNIFTIENANISPFSL